MKRLIIEILIILIFASTIGLIYNAFQASPLPLIPTQVSSNIVPDSILYNFSYETTEKDLDMTVSYEQMLKIINDDRFVLIDARSPDQYDEACIDGAINIFPEYEDEQQYVESIFQIPQNKTIIVYCDGGTCDLSHKLAKELLHFGFKPIFIYHGGWEDWSNKQPL